MNYKVNEIFESLQGEGFNTGRECAFLRLSGCNLSCSWCDTEYESGTEMTVLEILDQLHRFQSKSLVLTGGEPTLQPIEPLLSDLKKDGHWIALETNGTRNLEPFRSLLDYVTISPKLKKDHSLIQETHADEVRVVNDDLSFSDLFEVEQTFEACHYFLSPRDVNGVTNLKETIALLSQANQKGQRDWFLSLQMHKLLGIK